MNSRRQANLWTLKIADLGQIVSLTMTPPQIVGHGQSVAGRWGGAKPRAEFPGKQHRPGAEAFQVFGCGLLQPISQSFAGPHLTSDFPGDFFPQDIPLPLGLLMQLRQLDHLLLQFNQATIRLQVGDLRPCPFQLVVAPSHRALVAVFHQLFANGFDDLLRSVRHRVAGDEREAGFGQSLFARNNIVAFKAHDEREF